MPGHAATDSSCDGDGVCICKPTFAGDKCDECVANYYKVDDNCLGIKQQIRFRFS